MFSLFKKKVNLEPAAPLSFLQTDMHAHILPGIDDGAKDMAAALTLIEGMYKLGYKKLIATPHINIDFYPNSHENILTVLSAVQEAIKIAAIPIDVTAAAEYMIDEMLMELLASKTALLTLSGNKVLVEMSYVQESPLMLDALFALQSSGYQPVLAHPERYNYYHAHPVKYITQLKNQGFQMQLNVLALIGHYGKSVQTVAEHLLKAGLYDYCGTDVHHAHHVNILSGITKVNTYAALLKYTFMNIEL